MNTHAKQAIAGAIVCVGLAVLGVGVAGDPPPSGGDFTLRRATIDSGGGEGTAAEFSLKGTIGQHDTQVMETQAMEAADFTLRGGFWTPSGASDFVFRDGFEGG